MKDKKENAKQEIKQKITTSWGSMRFPSQDLFRATSTTATRISTAQLCPSQSDSRLPVPVNVRSNQGRLAADSVLQVRTSNSNSKSPFKEPTTEPKRFRNEQQRTMPTVDSPYCFWDI